MSPSVAQSGSSCSFSNDTPTPEIYTLSLHDALPISLPGYPFARERHWVTPVAAPGAAAAAVEPPLPTTEADAPVELSRSEEHTSELQSQSKLVCRLLLEKKNIASKVTCSVLESLFSN